jgi:hypothetical protein
MQIDFHHGVTYVVSRLAGFDHDAASQIAYCAQYVDDATNSGVIQFDNGALFSRLSSAHKMLDYRNFQELAIHRVWIPFHFLPGNNGLPADHQPSREGPDDLIDKLICRPNSHVAQDMIRDCIDRRNTPYGLHRLGITMHVYVDTWAHQGFAGINHPVNAAYNLVDGNGNPDRKLRDRLTGYFIGEALPLGHGAVLSHPDKPFLRWGYTNGRGELVKRDNPADFLQAADCMCRALQRYRAGDADADVEGLPNADRALMAQMLQTITDDKGEARHQKWRHAIAAGQFSCGPAQISYLAKGKGSWKHEALQTEQPIDKGDEVFPYHPEFLTSNWKRFHDALQAHHFYVLHELLPKYGICAA